MFQLAYAALDAKVLIMIYEEIMSMAVKLDKTDEASKVEMTLKKNKNRLPKTSKSKKRLVNIF